MFSVFLIDSLPGIGGLIHCRPDADGVRLSGLEVLVWHLADLAGPRRGPVFDEQGCLLVFMTLLRN